MEKKVITIGFEKDTNIENIKVKVNELKTKGYEVYSPFYIMYELGEVGLTAAKEYLKASINKSDIFYIFNMKEESETSIIRELREYAEGKQKVIYANNIRGCVS